MLPHRYKILLNHIPIWAVFMLLASTGALLYCMHGDWHTRNSEPATGDRGVVGHSYRRNTSALLLLKAMRLSKMQYRLDAGILQLCHHSLSRQENPMHSTWKDTSETIPWPKKYYMHVLLCGVLDPRRLSVLNFQVKFSIILLLQFKPSKYFP